MGRFSVLLLAIVLIAGCASTQSTFTIQLKVVDHLPHCGGPFPTPEQVNGTDEAVTGEVFGLIAGDIFSDTMHEPIILHLNDEGMCQLSLKAGNYALVLLDKWMESASFRAKYSAYDEQLYRVKDAACFEQWRTSVDFSLNVSGDSVVTFVRPNKCYTGVHPCLEYIGPKAP